MTRVIETIDDLRNRAIHTSICSHMTEVLNKLTSQPVNPIVLDSQNSTAHTRLGRFSHQRVLRRSRWSALQTCPVVTSHSCNTKIRSDMTNDCVGYMTSHRIWKMISDYLSPFMVDQIWTSPTSYNDLQRRLSGSGGQRRFRFGRKDLSQGGRRVSEAARCRSPVLMYVGGGIGCGREDVSFFGRGWRLFGDVRTKRCFLFSTRDGEERRRSMRNKQLRFRTPSRSCYSDFVL
jgi:hypothetical protein